MGCGRVRVHYFELSKPVSFGGLIVFSLNHSKMIHAIRVVQSIKLQSPVALLLVIRGVPRLIVEQPQVSAPLSSRPVAAYRKGGATPREESSMYLG